MINWTNVLDSLIAALPAIIAAIAAAFFSRKVHNQIKTPSGEPIGKVIEASHDTAIANNMLLSIKNGPTKNIEHDTVSSETVQMPDSKG